MATKSLEPQQETLCQCQIFCGLSRKKPPWAAYQVFMPGCLVSLDKLNGVRRVGVGEKCYRLFAKCVLKVTGSNATHACRDDQICAILKEGIDGAVNGVQSIWEDNLTEENWVLYLLTRIAHLTRSIEYECCGQSAIYGRLELFLF